MYVIGPVACALVLAVGMVPGVLLALVLCKSLSLPGAVANAVSQLLGMLTGIALLAWSMRPPGGIHAPNHGTHRTGTPAASLFARLLS
jgi:hypothetical protein